MLDMIINALIFISICLSSFVWHEVMHGVEAYRQGCRNIKVNLDFKRLSMNVDYWYCGDRDERLINLAGGTYTSFPLFILTFLSDGIWQASLLTAGWIQLLYSVFEAKYINRLSRKWYRIGRYSLYASVIALMPLFYTLKG